MTRRPRRGVRAVRWGVALLMVFVSAFVGVGGLGASARAESSGSSSVTVPGSGPFSSLKVTVSQTTNLIDQVVKVSWTGGAVTEPSGSLFGVNYLQLMQCWGDSSDGPDRTQCQYGASKYGGGGYYVGSRQLNGVTTDPDETYKTKPPAECKTSNVFVPFHSVTGTTTPCPSNSYYDASTTNEVDLARTQANGTGTAYFETQTATEAPGLGCGAAKAGATTGRRCWLVVVPRNDREVDGSVHTGTDVLNSSPLSATNWKNRLVIPLDFEPIGASCRIGSVETPTVGHELVTEAMNRWQPSLCGDTAVFGFSQVPVDAARRQVTSSQPGVAFMSLPVPSGEAADSSSLVYAPVTLSGVAIAFNVDQQYDPDSASAEQVGRSGARFPELNLTPRLVAKLITQSYQAGVDPAAKYLQKNPFDMTRDPEFLKYNPSFNHLSPSMSLNDVTLPIGQSDIATELWTWIGQDKSARSFLDGTPDPWGMIVNPNYKKLAVPINSFPKADLFCRPVPKADLCTFDAHPYAQDMHGASLAASNGDNLARLNLDIAVEPPVYKATGGAPNGQQQVLALTDTATAARYNLPTAKLMNAAGKFVAPDDASLLAGYKAMKPDPTTKSVLVPQPTSKSSAAYPLPMLTYGVTNPADLSAKDRVLYSKLLRYAAGSGQTPGLSAGMLPDGYVPLPSSLRSQTFAAASTIATFKAPATPSGASGDGDPSTTASDPGTSGTGTGATGTTPEGAAGVTPPTGTSPSPAITSPNVVAVASRILGVPVGVARYAVLAALVIGVVAAAGGAVLVMVERSRTVHP